MKYVKPELNITKFNTEEILTTSGTVVQDASQAFSNANVTVDNAVAVNVGDLLK